MIAATAKRTTVKFFASPMANNLVNERFCHWHDIAFSKNLSTFGSDRVNVYMYQTVLADIGEIIIHIMGRTSITPMGMPRPEGNSQTAARTCLCYYSADFHHNSVSTAIVHGAIIPGIHMTTEQDKLIWLLKTAFFRY